MQSEKRQPQAAFTLIEMMIAVALTVVLMSMIVYVWRNMSRAMTGSMQAFNLLSEARNVNEEIDKIAMNGSGCFPAIVGNQTYDGHFSSADLAVIDSAQTGGSVGESFTLTEIKTAVLCFRGMKWSPYHLKGGNRVQVDNNHASLAYLGTATTGYRADNDEGYRFVPQSGTRRWKANTEVYYGQTVIPADSELDEKHKAFMYKSLSGRSWFRDQSTAQAITGGTAPAWPSDPSYGQIVMDGDIQWLCVPPYLYANRHGTPKYGNAQIPLAYASGRTYNSTSGSVTFFPQEAYTGPSSKPYQNEEVGMADQCEHYVRNNAPTDSHSDNSDSGRGWNVNTNNMTSILLPNVTSFSVSALESNGAGGTTAATTESLIQGGKVTGFRGIYPQGMGYTPPKNGDAEWTTATADSDLPRRRLVRVEYSVVQRIRGDESEAPKPMKFTAMFIMTR